MDVLNSPANRTQTRLEGYKLTSNPQNKLVLEFRQSTKTLPSTCQYKTTSTAATSYR
ncbi:hypothetical protein HMPREF1991_02394 [Hoylesella loescheii DSM 19665 = JCM 12249 = ATCC 15930]|uniref:Uncharacterized protein n=1 Tax=Hoylesella loescheii DSM 19665 = JCM 12249 = ATCC 15930 TaxID=1122985 RepID=A0A069QFI0_HOYLO|nr:hypothetical protein HMPREF1991_02394 [Hoylesella loescheii DSM 19665 = JCM 12249 = ATCC 15930]